MTTKATAVVVPATSNPAPAAAAPAPAAGNAVQKTKSRTKAVAATKGGKPAKTGGRPVGKTTGVGVIATWVVAFQRNEKDHKDDAAITKFMNSEFPGKGSAIFNAVQTVRTRYNNGDFNDGVAPKPQSHRYMDGEQADPGYKGVAKAAEKAAAPKAVKAVKGKKASAGSPVVEKSRFTIKGKKAA